VDAAALELLGAIPGPVARKVRVTAIGCGDDARVRPAPEDEPWLDLLDAMLGERAGTESPREFWQRIQNALKTTSDSV